MAALIAAREHMFGAEWVKFYQEQSPADQKALSSLIACGVHLTTDDAPALHFYKDSVMAVPWAAKRPFAPGANAWASKNPATSKDLLFRYATRAALHDTWSREAIADATEWFTSHAKTSVVHLQLIAFTDVKWTTKTEAIQALIQRQIGPIPFRLARMLFNALGNPAVGQITPVHAFTDTQFPGPFASVPAGAPTQNVQAAARTPTDQNAQAAARALTDQ